MAQIIFSALVDSIRGKYNGSVFRKWGDGKSTWNTGVNAKSHAKLTKGDSGRYSQSKNSVNRASREWRDLSAGDKLAWNNAAALYPHTNRFGTPVTLSGFQYFMLIQLQSLAYFNQLLAAPPGVAPPLTVVSLTVTLGKVNEEFLIDTSGEVGDNWYLAIYAAVQRAEKSSTRKRNFKFMQVAYYDEGTSTNFYQPYLETFGSNAVGNAVDLKVFWINKLTMEQTAPVNLSATITT